MGVKAFKKDRVFGICEYFHKRLNALSLVLLIDGLFFPGCGSSSKTIVDTPSDFSCSFTDGLGTHGTNLVTYRSAAREVTFIYSSDGNKATQTTEVWEIEPLYVSKMDTELRQIDRHQVKSVYTDTNSAAARDGSSIKVYFTRETTTVSSEIDTQDSSDLPKGIDYVFSFCQEKLFKNQGQQRG